MNPTFRAKSLLLSLLLVSCGSKPAVNMVFSDLPKAALRGKIVAIGGFTAESSATYPGQCMEAEILRDTDILARCRLKWSRVLTPEETIKLAGTPPMKVSSRPPMRLGSRLTQAFIEKAHAHGIDYLLWIHLSGNDVTRWNRLWRSKRTEYSACTCGDVTEDGKMQACRSGGSCRSGCCSTCSRGEQITEFHNSESMMRRLSARHELIETGTGRNVWRTDSTLSRISTHTNTSTSDFPLAPPPLFPDEESQMMRSMGKAAMNKLPR
ncbi:MAG: hypothetical protein ACKO8Z_05915, partial [Prosthecobacter sp.]